MEPRGLSTNEVSLRLRRDGPNEISSAGERAFLHIVVEVLREPMTILLLVCGMIYGFLGELQDALILLGFWALIIVITVLQERKTEKALSALKSLSSPRALVIRDGRLIRISARELVVDDLVQVNVGDVVPADVLILESVQGQIDESLLTGESFAVFKKANDKAWAGTIVVQGQIFGQVIATGMRTQLGSIGKLLVAASVEPTPLKAETQRIIKRLTVLAIFFSVFTAAAYFYLNKDLLGGVLLGLTLAMAILPNEIPAVLTIFLTLGTRRLSERNVLTRKITAVDSIGATTVLCVDKTGTLTVNKMKIQQIYLNDSSKFSREDLLKIAVHASNPNTFDPMEQAIATEYDKSAIHERPFQQFQLTSDFFAMSNLWLEDSGQVWITTKGAPETIIKMCVADLVDTRRIHEEVERMALSGLRVLGVAQGRFDKSSVPSSQEELSLEFVGLIGFADPVREGVPSAVKQCYEAGIRVIMMTGDHSQTASSVGQQIGLKNPLDVLTGASLEKLSDSELSQHLQTTNCFSRMIPEQKLRIVKILQAQGEVVAMTGDGVNDAPALKAANIGIAMGKKGTDVARESAAIVLLDDNFTTIVEGIKTGRGIYENLKSAMSYLVAVHIPIAGISILPVLLKLPIILMPVHVAFLHLIIEPTCSLVFEAEPASRHLMMRPPRRKNEPIFSKTMLVQSMIQGLILYAVIFVAFAMALHRGQGDLDARALAFTILIFANLALIYMNRYHRESVKTSLRNKYLWPILLISFCALMLVLYVPSLRKIFHFSVLHWDDVGISILAAMLSIIIFQIWKHCFFQKDQPRS